MLCGLTIQNVVLIETLSISFEKGFNALTGETGAGKSILLDSLGLALGARADTGLVRKSTDQAAVTAEFFIDDNHPALALLEEQGMAADRNLVLRRQLGSDGRSRAFVNDQPVSVGLLKQIGDMLVEIHGQFETHGLLDSKTHRAMLDEYAGLDDTLPKLWKEWRANEKALKEAQDNIAKMRAEEEYLRQALEDLDALSPKQGEEEELATLRTRLMSREKIIESLSGADEGITEADSVIGQTYRLLERAGDEVAPILEALDRASAEMQEAAAQLQSLSADLEHCEYSLEEIDDRLHAIRAQARKHHCEADDLPQKREEIAAQLNMVEAEDDVVAGLMKAVEKCRDAYIRQAETVHEKRLTAAATLDELVSKELPPLKLEKARFVTQVEKLEESQWHAHGFDKVQFVVATNPGAEPGPLNKIASGGELARFTLALKVVMAEVGTVGSMIFDEVDTGIGGSTAAAVGDRLSRLARSRQILVVTHAPQVAARADNHFIVMKSGDTDITTTIIPLSELHDRREEIARMLAGAEITTEARAAADKLLETGS